MRIVCRCKTSLSLHSQVDASNFFPLQLPHTLRSQAPVIGPRMAILPKTASKIPREKVNEVRGQLNQTFGKKSRVVQPEGPQSSI
jgi:hypothetical protein